MIKNSLMSSLIEIFESVEEKIKRIKNPVNKLKFIDDCIDWVKVLLDLLNKLKQELEEAN